MPDVNSLFLSNAGSLALSLCALALAFAGSMLFYGYLADRVWFEGQGRVRSQQFGPVDLLMAGGLTLLFAVIITSGFASGTTPEATKLPSSAQMILGVVASSGVMLLIMAVIVGSLVLRQAAWSEAFGLRAIGVGSVAARAVLLLMLAFPLIYGALGLTHLLLAGGGHGDDTPQELVRFLAAPGTGAARTVVALSAVFIAPVQEEFIFRGYIYGVARRYAGPVAGIAVNAALFAGIHLHAPSLGGLFVLAVCLTLAYEWTGSLFVPITMHALFNSLSVISLLTGNSDR